MIISPRQSFFLSLASSAKESEVRSVVVKSVPVKITPKNALRIKRMRERNRVRREIAIIHEELITVKDEMLHLSRKGVIPEGTREELAQYIRTLEDKIESKKRNL